MKLVLTRNWGILALAAFLILYGLAGFGLSLPPIVMAILALAAGVLILIGR